MTALDLQFRIDQGNAEIYVNSISSPLLTPVGLASNISFVSFAQGSGHIVYNDRPPIAELFSDPSPYQSYINQWITTLSLAIVNPLTLAQAQAVKCALVNAVYAVKRAAPVTVAIGGTPYQWDASDTAVGRMAPLASLAYLNDLNGAISSINGNVASVVSSLDTDVGALASSINSSASSLVSGINADVDEYNTLASSLGSFQANLQNNLNSWVSTLTLTEAGVSGWTNPGNMTVPGVSNPSEAHVSWATVSFTAPNYSNVAALTVPTMQLLPYGGSALVTLAPSDVKAIMQAIASQYAAKSLLNSQKQAAVNALTLMQDVISYDATAGW